MKNGLKSNFEEAFALSETIQKAADRLAQLANAEDANPKEFYPYATEILAQAPLLIFHKAIKAIPLRNANQCDEAPCHLAHCLLTTLLKAVSGFEDLMMSRPRLFVYATRQLLHLPTVRSVRGNDKTFRKFVDRLELGADYNLKTKGAISFESEANITVLHILLCVRHAKRLWRNSPDTFLKGLARKTFPPLIRERSSVDFWWKHAVRPFLRKKIAVPDKYRHLAERVSESDKRGVKKKWRDWEKCKPELRGKNLFETACKKALRNLALPAARKSKLKIVRNPLR